LSRKWFRFNASFIIVRLRDWFCQVTGHTGKCILTALRQLDLIDVDFKAGVVTVAAAL
jgi:hypothetical protein